MGLAAHFLLIGLCAIVFIPASALGLSAAGTVAPVTISLFVGAFIFGLGMQLANGCGSGVLYSFGSGSGRMMVALPFFIIGSVLGSFLLPSALGWGSVGPVAIAGGLSDGLRTIVNLSFISVAGFGFYLLGRHRGQQLSKRLVLACLVIAALCWAVFVLSGHPWGVTFGFTLWGAKLAQDIGIPVENFTFWQWPGPARIKPFTVIRYIQPDEYRYGFGGSHGCRWFWSALTSKLAFRTAVGCCSHRGSFDGNWGKTVVWL
ncbi:MAG: hypothetical protein CM15mP100_6820 [Alphaproteobacteria bacterium]|nr:MAG: hypothetical protein CM15mP100_6820 [Alphaproteobacteria bacterium]